MTHIAKKAKIIKDDKDVKDAEILLENAKTHEKMVTKLKKKRSKLGLDPDYIGDYTGDDCVEIGLPCHICDNHIVEGGGWKTESLV